VRPALALAAQHALPSFFGYDWENWRFLAFNGVWVGVFIASAVAVARGRRLGYLGAFLAVGGGIGHGLAHLALAAAAGGYFPGLYTAPLVIGTLLLARLLQPSPA
jgi:hypothetical protein